MKNSQELFSYPIVVIESLWPKLPEEAPKLVGPQKTDVQNAYIYSETQNAFGGYFKIIPLNIKNISVSASKTGHKFDIIFDSSYVYVQINPRYISKEIYNYVVRSAFKFTQTPTESDKGGSFQDLHYLSGILEGYSKSDLESDKFEGNEHYFVPGTIISKIVNEMDTVTIFLVQDLAVFSQEELIKVAAGGLSRRREVEVFTGTKSLADLGIVKPFDFIDDVTALNNSLRGVSLGYKLQALRSLLTNNGIGRYSVATTADITNLSLGQEANAIPTPYVASKINLPRSTPEKPVKLHGVGYKDRTSSRNNELNIIDSIKNDVDKNKFSEVSAKLALFGVVVSEYLTDLLKTEETRSISGAKRFLENIKVEIVNYYDGENKDFSRHVPWSFYKSVEIVLRKYIKPSPGSDIKTHVKNDLQPIIKTACMDAYFAIEFPSFYVSILDILSTNNVIKFSSNDLAQTDLLSSFDSNILILKNRHKNTNNEVFFELTKDTYQAGLNSFFDKIITERVREDQKKLTSSEQVININNIQNLILNSDLKLLVQDLGKFSYPISCETPYFVLNGHITRISDNFSISESSVEKSITISGQGFELPMQTHNIYHDPFDMVQQFFKSITTMTIANATPIAAALAVMAIHLPDYPQYFSRDGSGTSITKNALQNELKDQRNFDLYKNTLGYFIERGAVLRKKPLKDDFLVYAPIHYIDKSYLKIIKSTFDTTLIASQQIQVEQRNIGEGSVYNTLQGFLSNSSMYSFFIDEFGTMKLRFEPSCVAQTSSTILSPPITDSVLKSLSLTTDSNQIYNMVEVVPKNFSGLTEGALKSGFYGRATAPDITEVYGLYKELPLSSLLDNEVTDGRKTLYNFLSAMMHSYKEALESIRVDFNTRPKDEKSIQLVNPVVREKLITYAELEEFFGVKTATFETQPSNSKTEEIPKTDNEKQDEAPILDDVGPPSDLCTPPEEETTGTSDSADSTAQAVTAKPEKPIVKKMYEQIFSKSKISDETLAAYTRVLISGDFKSATSGSSVIPVVLDRDRVPGTYTGIYKLEKMQKGLAIKKDLGDLPKEQINYYSDYLTSYLILKLRSLYADDQATEGITVLRDITKESILTLIDLMSTCFYFGVDFSQKNGWDLFNSYFRPYNGITLNKNLQNYLSWIAHNTNLFYYPETLGELRENEKAANIPERESRRIPFIDYKIQEMHPQNIAADYFRYGLRNIRQEDYYSTSMLYTEFRAETLRKLHEYPMKTANITTLLNPIYKIGNTVLVVSEKSDNNKNTYVNTGLKNTLQNFASEFFNSRQNTTTAKRDPEQGFEPQGYQLILRVDDIVKEGKQIINMNRNSLYTKLTDLKADITESTIVKHFSDSIAFMLEKSEGAPIPADAYVPLLGIYTPNNNNSNDIRKTVMAYLFELVKFNTAHKQYQDKFGKYVNLYESLENSILNVYKAVYPNQAYSSDNFNHLNNLLRPQNYHAVQYHINTVTHSWVFGRGATTNIGGNFGIPSLITYVPTNSTFDFDMHILGHIVTKGPNFPFNESGSQNTKIRTTNPAYQFAKQQMITEERFYKSKYRFNIGLILEKIRRKHTMPEVYGELLSFGSGVK